MEKLADNTIVYQVLEGNTEAFRFIVERYSGILYNMIVRMVDCSEDAEDLLQEVFIKVYNKLSSFHGDSSFGTWIYRVAYNETVTRLRKNKRVLIALPLNETILESDDLADEDDSEMQYRLEDLKRALDKLPPLDRNMLMMFYQEDKDVKEIAHISNLSESNVKVRLFRLRKKLKELMTASI